MLFFRDAFGLPVLLIRGVFLSQNDPVRIAPHFTLILDVFVLILSVLMLVLLTGQWHRPACLQVVVGACAGRLGVAVRVCASDR